MRRDINELISYLNERNSEDMKNKIKKDLKELKSYYIF